MIGQKDLQELLKNQIYNNKFPRFSIITGSKGSGKKTITQEISKWLGTNYVLSGISADDIRNTIDMAYKVEEPTLYVIADADTMRDIAKNTMLKVTEEPPNNAYFILTLQDENNTLDTIKSRGTIYRMNNYTNQELETYYNLKYSDNATLDICKSLCSTPWEVDKIVDMGAADFNKYVKLVVDNIATVSGANSFKIAEKIALSDTDSGYDLGLFWKSFMAECLNRMDKDNTVYAKGVITTSHYLQQLRIVGVNKVMCFDNWILEIRRGWMNADS